MPCHAARAKSTLISTEWVNDILLLKHQRLAISEDEITKLVRIMSLGHVLDWFLAVDELFSISEYSDFDKAADLNDPSIILMASAN